MFDTVASIHDGPPPFCLQSAAPQLGVPRSTRVPVKRLSQRRKKTPSQVSEDDSSAPAAPPSKKEGLLMRKVNNKTWKLRWCILLVGPLASSTLDVHYGEGDHHCWVQWGAGSRLTHCFTVGSTLA